MRLWVALSAVLVTFVAACGGAQAYTPPITMKVFPLAAGHPSGPMVAGLDGNMWLQEGNGVASAPAPRVAVLNAQGGVVKELAAGGAGALGPDGNFWFEYGPKIGRMTPAGAIAYFRMSSSSAEPDGITAGPDGNLWFYDQGGGLYRITTAGAITKVAQFANDVGGIAAGADGNVWVTVFYRSAYVARVTPAGVVTQFPFPKANSEPKGIAAGPDGNLWVAEQHLNAIARVTTDGVITEFPIARAGAAPIGILAGVDGNLWFTESPACCPMQPMVGRITPSGTITEIAAPAGADIQQGPFAGSDGNLWFGLGGSYSGATGAAGRLSVKQAGTRYVLSRDAGLAPGNASAALGGDVQWEFYGPSVHEVADTSGFGQFDSGPIGIVGSFRQRFNTAGVYAYADPLDPGQTGKVTVAPYVGLGTATTSAGTFKSFTIAWSFGPVPGSRVFDVQLRRPGETSYSNWKTGTTDDAASLTPDVHGTYSFRARMRDTATGAKTGYAARSGTYP